MLISYNWIKEYLPLELSPQKLAEELTLMGLEVTEVIPVCPPISGLCVGEVIEKWKHPNADRLNLTRIRHLDKGREVVDQVVCGAANIAAGQKILLATVGTELSPGFLIKKAKIRGEESCGMVCSKEELGQEEKSEGIWVLPSDTPLNTDPQVLRGEPDHLLDFDITSNRWDCMNVFGIVREVSVLLDKTCTHEGRGSFARWESQAGRTLPNFDQLPAQSRAQIEIEDSADCYRYQGLDITDITVSESPEWLSSRLFRHGIRSIDNVVDVTNLILREYGQPIHAFDADKIGKAVTIRLAREGETLILLDGKKIQLTPEDLLIADENGPIALAGVMGGLESGVTSGTKHVFLEVAVFDPKRIRQTMQRHQLNTDAGKYFQHKVDPVFSAEVIRIAGAAIAHLGKGTIPTQPLDVFPTRERFASKEITLSLELLEKTLGFLLTKNEINDFFSRLGFTSLRWEEKSLTVNIPSYRQDLEQEWDLIEEVARVYGYNNIPITYPRITNGFGALTKSVERKRDDGQQRFRALCLSLGFHEILTYPFIENSFAGRLGMGEEKFLKPMNPVWSDISLLRNSLLFGFLKTIQLNSERKVTGFNRTFEISKVFSPLTLSENPAAPSVGDHDQRNSSAYEHNRLGLAVWEGESTPHWKYSPREADYAELSGAMEELFRQFFGEDEGICFYPGANGDLAENLKNAFAPDSTVRVVWRDHEIGVIGMVADSVKDYFGLESVLVKKKIFYAELDLDSLLAELPGERSFHPFSVYPAVKRDLAMVMAREASIQDILKELPRLSSLLTQVNVTDIYEGENIPSGKKSVVFSLEFIAPDKTLKRADADQEVLRLVDQLKKKYTFTLR